MLPLYRINSIETQHWRHEFFLGLCIDSSQIEPIEQESNEGDRTGQFTSEYLDELAQEGL